MAYELANRLSLKILFNEDEFMFDRANSIDFIHMSSSTRIAIPMLHMALQDNVDSLSESKHFCDGALIQITLSDSSAEFSVTYAFRYNTHKRTPHQGGYRYEVDGYLDANTWWHASVSEHKKGSSYKVINEIADDCGLKFEGDQTTDAQTWFPRNIPYHEWARQVSERGYKSDTSFMQMGLNFDKTLVYKDINTNVEPSIKFTHSEFKDGFLTATDVQPATSSGSMNHYSGYAETLIEQDIEDKELYKINDKVSISKKASEGKLMMNAKIKDAVKQARVVFAPIDVGNVHPEYEKARYQNRRQNNLHSVRIELVTKEATKAKLLDKITVNMDKSNGYLKIYSGDYRVSSRTIFIKSNEYYEKFELTRKTMNIDLKDSVG